MPQNFYIATAIDYTNSAPHIGHAYEKILADTLARYRRLRGDHVFFLSGVDQHGQKVQQSAEKQGLAPREFVAALTTRFTELWAKLDVQYDGWAATVEPQHQDCVKGILQRLFDEGQLYRAKQGGHYSVRQEQFLTDKERGSDGEFGPEWGEVEYREEENYYFKLAEHKDWLLQLIDTRADLVYPAFRRGELRNAVEKLTGDLCISRPKSRLSWGIELPFDPDYVTYVWFDALVNYISFAPQPYDPRNGEDRAEFASWWPATIVIGKDILIPAHGIYWMIMLHALGFSDAQMPPLIVHGWWNIAGAKISKSLGNVVDPDALAERYGSDGLRYYLLTDIATGKDADFSEERLLARYHGDLANSLGNLVNRTLSMAQRYRAGVIRHADFDSPLRTGAATLLADYTRYFEEFQPQAAVAAVSLFLSACNGYIDTKAPWKLAKDPAASAELDGVLYALGESLRIVAILLSPVLPKATQGIFDQLNWKLELAGEARFRLSDAAWGQMPSGHEVGKPVPLFPRIEAAASPAG